MRVRFGSCAALLALAACARVPASPEAASASEPTPEPSVVETEPPPTPPSPPKVLGDPAERATALAELEGIWGFEREVWEIRGSHARVYRPLDEDIVVEREIEMLAPCMFIAREGDAVLGPYVVNHFGSSDWTRGATAAYRQVSAKDFTICRAPAVIRLEANRCKAWRYDLDSQTFTALDACEWGNPRTPTEFFFRLRGAEGEILDEFTLPEIIVDRESWASREPNLASGCERYGPGEPGCTAAQLELLRERYWAEVGPGCSGSDLRIELEPLFEGSLVRGPSECPFGPTADEPAYFLAEGVTVTPQPASVRPGDTTQVEFVFENTSTQPRIVRLPTDNLAIVMRDGGQELEMGGCMILGVGYVPRPTKAAQFRLDPGGKLTLAAKVITIRPQRHSDHCTIEPLPAKDYEVALELEDDPSLVLRTTVRVEGQPTCSPCQEP